MHLQPPQSNGPQAHDIGGVEQKPDQPFSSALPFGQHLPLSSINPATYLTAQTLIQQTSFLLSDKIFTYSPDTFDLDIELKRWEQESEKNSHDFRPHVQQMEIRSGAGNVALGYLFSQDFDLGKKNVPQTIIASAATLPHLRSSLDQLSLLYNVASPVTVQLAAVDYTSQGKTGLITDYATPQNIAEDLGLALVSSTSIFESQHMALLSYLIAKFMPAIHVYDGVHIGRETTRVVDVLGKDGLSSAYKAISHDVSDAQFARMDSGGKALKLLQAFNDELGTDYKPFEYFGHTEAETVLVAFGSVEGALAGQVAQHLANSGEKVGAINVRVYRPFIEESFIETLPTTVRVIKTLGQVKDLAAVADVGETSGLYSDVLAAVAFADKLSGAPSVVDTKYPREQKWTPVKMALVYGRTLDGDVLEPSVKRYNFWDLDASLTSAAPALLAQTLASKISDNVSLRSARSNLTRGGTLRTDIRTSSHSIEAPFSVTAASTVYVGEQDIFKDYDVLKNVSNGGMVIARLPGAKAQDEEKLSKRLPDKVKKLLIEKDIKFFILDPEASATVMSDMALESPLVQLAFLRLSNDIKISPSELEGQYSKETVASLVTDLDNGLYVYEYPEAWKALEEISARSLPNDVRIDSFVPYPSPDAELAPAMKTSLTAAQAFTFREAYGAAASLRPDAGTKTYTIHVKDHRRLTPPNYDRNIFHIEFDLGTSGMKYNLGEALGIHAENNAGDVDQFIKWYDLDASAIVSVPSRADAENVVENRTVYQTLMQNIDIFGRPPKRFYAELAEFASNPDEEKELRALGGPEGAVEFKRRGEVDTITYADILLEFPSAHPSFADIVKLVGPLKRREYSIASSQHAQPDSVSLLIVTVNWVDPNGRDRFGQATRYLDDLRVGDPITVSVKPSVMKLPKETTAPIVMAGLGTGLAPFRAFVQERAYQRDVLGKPIGDVMLFLGSRHQREEYLYGEEWEAYQDAGVLTHMGCAFSRDQPQKIYIQGRMREAMDPIRSAIWRESGAFYLCGPTWPVPDVTEVLQESVEAERKEAGAKKVNSRREIEELKDEGRYVLEVY